jgi:hypothetical protein
VIGILSSPAVFQKIEGFALDVVTQVSRAGVFKPPTSGECVCPIQTALSQKIDEVERYYLSTLLGPMQTVNSLVAEGTRITTVVDRYSSAVTFIKTTFLESDLNDTVALLKSACLAYAMGDRIDPKTFSTALPALQLLATFIALSRHSPSEIPAFFEALADVRDSFTREVPLWERVITAPAALQAALKAPSGSLFRAVRQVADGFLFALYYAEAAKLEALVRLEALTLAAASASPLQLAEWSETFKRFITGELLNQGERARVAGDELLQFVSNRVSAFFQKTRAIPGGRSDLRYVDFEPPRPWAWTAIPDCPFPGTPAEVRDVLQHRGDLQKQIEEFILSEETPMCGRCGDAIAVTVCPKCRRIVLCNQCRRANPHCPREGCDVTFA